jgi:hypothetical protein
MNLVIKNYLLRFSTLKKYIMEKSETNHGATVVTEQNRELFIEGKAKIHTKYI